ncbi:molybdate ABC transporter substrate-binding protein [Aurantiacibacter rhizosphaerae]|uniref:Molybdate ABC transporter substrate-binding protein n=1 Tax=Aurantiacibacter rhizosphaerae TaxID=2691582 RepID=A0A844XC44_9SPHN|nr:molybdate ABC transporter substrate-binding protein [Aurantiacibacter rhizosphaerae]MWV27188.1 molybdate ABC transporter substrate-binding protein [Aurantiacibacter rhizosphaerae]
MAAVLTCLMLAACSSEKDTGPVVLAAASMQEGLNAAADSWTAAGHASPVLSFASSAAVARQVSEGAPADIVITADDRWMNWLASQGALAGDALRLVSNSLVVVAPAGKSGPESLAAFAQDANAGRLAIGEPDSVPAGEFARTALQNMGLWDALSTRLAPGDNVRASLALVERGEAALGIVYASDAAASDRVRVVERIAADMHPPIIYYAAQVAGSRHPGARGFLAFLTSEEGRQVIAGQGFDLP